MGEPEDAQLVALARDGDKTAFGMLLGRHREAVIAACARLLSDAAPAEDAVQEASIRALLNLDRLQRPERFRAWLTGIALNVLRTWRRQSDGERQSWEAIYGGRLEPTISPEQEPGRIVEAAEAAASVRSALAGLPKAQRTAATLFYLGGLTQRETSALLGIELGAVKNRLHKARARLREELWEWQEDHRMQAEAQSGEVEMRVADVRRRAAEGDLPSRSVVLLEEVGGSRRLPIWIGEFEGTAIALSLEKIETPRPGPYDLMLKLLEAGAARLAEVRITRLVEDTFLAEAVVKGRDGQRAVDCRPSDALALAVLTGVRITVDVGVVDANQERARKLGLGRDGEGYPEGARQIATQAKERWTAQLDSLRRQSC